MKQYSLCFVLSLVVVFFDFSTDDCFSKQFFNCGVSQKRVSLILESKKVNHTFECFTKNKQSQTHTHRNKNQKDRKKGANNMKNQFKSNSQFYWLNCFNKCNVSNENSTQIRVHCNKGERERVVNIISMQFISFH